MREGDAFSATRAEPDGRTITRLFTIDRITATGIIRASCRKVRLRPGSPGLIAQGFAASFRKSGKGLRPLAPKKNKGARPSDWVFYAWYVPGQAKVAVL